MVAGTVDGYDGSPTIVYSCCSVHAVDSGVQCPSCSYLHQDMFGVTKLILAVYAVYSL